jgi:flagellar biosynthetic protein FliO
MNATSDFLLDKPAFAPQPTFPAAPPAVTPAAVAPAMVVTEVTSATTVTNTVQPASEDRLPDPATSLAAPLAVLALLGVAAFLLRRRTIPGRERTLRVLETTSLGPRRQLVLAEVHGEWMLLGSFESGLTLLKSGPTDSSSMVTPDSGAGSLHGSSTVDAAGNVAAVLPFRTNPGEQVPRVHQDRMPWLSMWARLRGGQPTAAPAPTFDQVLEESAEDELLRRKLQAGLRGRVSP